MNLLKAKGEEQSKGPIGLRMEIKTVDEAPQSRPSEANAIVCIADAGRRSVRLDRASQEKRSSGNSANGPSVSIE
jgi:hypothetical protein